MCYIWFGTSYRTDNESRLYFFVINILILDVMLCSHWLWRQPFNYFIMYHIISHICFQSFWGLLSCRVCGEYIYTNTVHFHSSNDTLKCIHSFDAAKKAWNSHETRGNSHCMCVYCLCVCVDWLNNNNMIQHVRHKIRSRTKGNAIVWWLWHMTHVHIRPKEPKFDRQKLVEFIWTVWEKCVSTMWV